MNNLDNNQVHRAAEALKNGEMILLFDSDNREGETDFVIPANRVTPSHVYNMRKDGGGLICVAIHPLAAGKLGLPFYADILRNSDLNGDGKILRKMVEKDGDIPYDSKSSFSLWVNHRDTFTGITDKDRSLTISRIGEFVNKAMNGMNVDLSSEFRSPGHVSLLRAADGLVNKRAGQTELSVVLAEFAGIIPAMAICEMLDETNGLALSKEGAMKYADEHGLVFIEGKDVIQEFNNIN
ncbi:MAG: 3,4-dihydroxy-2-butanone-4-phosphate synthase [ANME-2 cluster archaeon]|nr:3,4-dihydroxy-2-butanone-4-phosphate synthase [ANME-2 cluster archaeon]MBC2702886.1 3,4-dihydroxy-2-butanone-4-phosphate synthase [ANME-2 cluster archaeon]MBC2706453.1 3,4-dihydroxy-2-butanone-4-phosphate synthase [ANME-2 cluster archaeon]MBC2747718.1 3,4-dihydroxy-2-butanone-4-phosphate synthase [ANME-2 cluster archaeon]MBC2761768.1 3,4-dihydroxy-2-butanone-4-phosphate synthase [ANME-2 cluster archaeon]